MNINRSTAELFETFYSRGYLRTITKPTRITKTIVTLIDNIYIQCNKPHIIISGIINSQISDHLPVFVFAKTKITIKLENSLKVKSCSITDSKIESMKTKLNEYEWNMLSNMSVEEGYTHFIKKLTNFIDECAPEKKLLLKKKNIITDKWVTPGLIKSARTARTPSLYNLYQ